jgi:hypothetical protein
LDTAAANAVVLFIEYDIAEEILKEYCVLSKSAIDFDSNV